MAYTNSSLVDYTKLSPNNSGLRKHGIDTITIHCVVGQCSVQTLGSIFSRPSYQASANYGIGYDGKIGMYVEEKNRSWCSSSPENDNRAITIEVASDTKHPYAVNSVAYSTLIKLVTDICKRNGIKKLVWSTSKNTRVNHLNGCNMTAHRDFCNKSCPGDYLYNRMGQIAKEVNANLSETSKPSTKPETSKPSASKPSTSSKLKFKVGDIIQFKGGAVYTTSGGSKSSGNATAGKAKVTVIAEGTKHPYHIIHEDKNSTVYGWVNAGNVLSLTEESKPSSKPSTSKPSTSKPSTSKPQSKKKVIIEDGIWGKNTNIYTQKHFGTEVDGIISGQKTGAKKYLQSIEASAWQFKLLGKGSPVAKKIQSLVGVKADGFIGPDTIKAIQKYLSAKGYYTGKIDGIMGVNTVKGWQKLVNSWF